MPKGKKAGSSKGKPNNGINLGFATKMQAAADMLRNNMDAAEYKHVVLGLIFSAGTVEIATYGYVLTHSPYAGVEEVEDDDEPFDEKMKHLTAKLKEQCAESARLDKVIWANLKELGYGR